LADHSAVKSVDRKHLFQGALLQQVCLLGNPHQKPHGVVVWDIKVKNQRQELVATYDILTLVERGE